MLKKISASQRIAKKSATSRNRSAKKLYRSGPATLPDALPIVERDSGRSLRLRVGLGMNRETFARLVPMLTRNLANIEGGKRPSANALRQLQELRRRC